MEDNKPTMSNDKFTNLPTLDSLSSNDETSQYGSLSFGGFQNTGSTNSTGTAVNRPFLPGPSTAELYRAPVAFDPGARNIERYKDHPAYKRLGFSVLRDNELHYNASN